MKSCKLELVPLEDRSALATLTAAAALPTLSGTPGPSYVVGQESGGSDGAVVRYAILQTFANVASAIGLGR